jgi:toxin YoeB
MNKNWSDEAWGDYLYWQTQDRKTLKKINDLLRDIERNGASAGIGRPEPLKENLSGLWSRRIDEKNRLVYRVEDNTIFILICKEHYSQ